MHTHYRIQLLPAGCGEVADTLRDTSAPSPVTARSARVLSCDHQCAKFLPYDQTHRGLAAPVRRDEGRFRTASPAPSPISENCRCRGRSLLRATSLPCAHDQSVSVGDCT